MLDLQNEKKIILEFLNEIDNSDEKKISEILTKYTSNNFKMRCTHPFNELEGVDQIANRLWLPIKKSFKKIQRRMDIFYAGINSHDTNQGTWVSSMGHLMGVFNKSFFGLQPNNKSVLLRYAEFYKIENNKITEGAFFLDLMNIEKVLFQGKRMGFPNRLACQ